MVKLYMMDASEESQSFDLKIDTIYIGRSPDNDVQMKDKYVSRNHLKIHRKGDKYFIEDLKSANGTFVNGTQIPSGKECEVKEGVAIAIGMSLICLGQGCLAGVMDFLDSIYFSEDISEESEVTIQNRPMTHKKNMELIYKVSNALMQSSNINEILEKILNYIFELLKRIDRGVIILLDEETGKISEVPSMPKKRSDDTMMMYSRSIVHRVLREGKAIMMSDTLGEDRVNRSESMELMKIRSVMCVPLISKSQIRGVIYVDSLNKPNGFRNEDLSLLTALSSPAAIAIENAFLCSTLDRIMPDRPKYLERS